MTLMKSNILQLKKAGSAIIRGVPYLKDFIFWNLSNSKFVVLNIQ